MDNKFSAYELDLVQLYDIGEQIINNYKKQLDLDNVIASGELVNSIDWNIVQKDENTLTLEMTILEHYIWVEFGRLPTSNNTTQWVDSVGDIERWYINKMKRNKLIPKPNQEIPTTQKEIRKVAYAIVNKIHRFGFYGYNSEGKHSLGKSLQKSVNEGLIDKFVNGISQDFADQIKVELNKLSIRKIPKQKKV